MPEVIDLLSSSPQAAPPQPARTVPAPVPAPAPFASKPSLPQLDQKQKSAPRASEDDIFDLTDPTVISSFLRSPAPPSTKRGTAPASKPASQKTTRADDFLFLSDDFDTAVDLSGPSPDPRPLKRPRVETDTGTGSRNIQVKGGVLLDKANPRSTLPSVAGPPVLRKSLAPRKPNTSLDPIQTSSDPFASSPREAPKGRAGPTIIDLSKDYEDENPFASLPHPDTGNDKYDTCTKAGARRPPSSLLISSPPSSNCDLPLLTTKSRGQTKGLPAWDHISSSAPETNARDDWLLNPGPKPGRSRLKRSRSDSKDFDLGDLAHMSCTSDDDSLPDINDLRPGKFAVGRGKNTTATMRTSTSKKSEGEKNLEKSAKATARDAEKQRKQKEREDTKAKKKREKEEAAALAEVNKVRTDKKVSTPEMIVDLPLHLKPSVRLQIETLLEDLHVKCHSYSSPVQNVVKWRRKVKARFNKDEGHWEPIPERIEEEKHAMVMLHAAEFVELALGPEGSDLAAHTLALQQHYKNHVLIYLIEGLGSWIRKNRTVRDQQFKSAVRNVGAQPEPNSVADTGTLPPSTQRSRKKNPKPPPVHVDEDAIEDALLQLQVWHGALIHHTASAVETAQWVTIFTQHISTIPYRRQKDAANASAAFCMDSGQVRTGEGAQDTYVRMLQEIVRITPPIAHGINSKFPSVTELVQGFQQQGPLALESIKKSANRDGAFTDRTVGQAISRRVHKVFTGRDEGSTDI